MKRKQFIYSKLYMFILLAILLVGFFIEGSEVIIAHLIYIPIIFGGIMFGVVNGLTYGIFSGLLIGLLFKSNNFKNETIDWLVRLISYSFAGSVSAFGKTIIDRSERNYYNLLIKHINTDIYNVNYLKLVDTKIYSNNNSHTVTILIHNYENIVRCFGQFFYYEFLTKLNNSLSKELSNPKIIMGNNSNKFFIITRNNKEEEILDRIKKALEKEILVDNIPLYFEYSVGVSEIDNIDDTCILTMFNESNLKAYNEYSSNSYTNKSVKVDYKLISEFKEALQNEELKLVYQPIISSANKEKNHLESLVRWIHPKRGIIPPNEFIPLLEETKLINDLTLYILERNLKLIKECEEQGHMLSIGINISIVNLNDDYVVSEIIRLIEYYDVKPNLIELELVESVLIDLTKPIKNNIDKIRRFGINLSIDDFGTGYSSLSYLADLDIDFFKLDKTFIDKIGEDKATEEIIKFTIELADALALQMVAEGVETKAQADFLNQYNCHFQQGFYYAKPFSRGKIHEWLNSKKDV